MAVWYWSQSLLWSLFIAPPPAGLLAKRGPRVQWVTSSVRLIPLKAVMTARCRCAKKYRRATTLKLGARVRIKQVHPRCNRWNLVRTASGQRGWIDERHLSPLPILRLKKRKPIRKLYVRGPRAVLRPWNATRRYRWNRVRVLPPGKGVQDLGPKTPTGLWHYVKTPDGRTWLANPTELTPEKLDPVRSARAWRQLLAKLRRKGKIIRRPPASELVTKSARYRGKMMLGLLRSRKSSSSSLRFYSLARVAYISPPSLDYLVHWGSTGRYLIRVPFYELSRPWKKYVPLQLVLQFRGVFKGRLNKVPVLYAVAAFDGARVYRDWIKRCFPYYRLATQAFRTQSKAFWRCLKVTPRHWWCSKLGHLEQKILKSYRRQFFGCANSCQQRKRLAQVQPLGKALEQIRRALRMRMRALVYPAGSHLLVPALRKARSAERAALRTLDKLAPLVKRLSR